MGQAAFRISGAWAGERGSGLTARTHPSQAREGGEPASPMARPSALAGLAAVLFCVTRPAAAQIVSDCSATNVADTPANGGAAQSCSTWIATGAYTCAVDFGAGGGFQG